MSLTSVLHRGSGRAMGLIHTCVQLRKCMVFVITVTSTFIPPVNVLWWFKVKRRLKIISESPYGSFVEEISINKKISSCGLIQTTYTYI